MSTNFDFLKNVDKDLFEIITEAEKLYRDEYFEQWYQNVLSELQAYEG